MYKQLLKHLSKDIELTPEEEQEFLSILEHHTFFKKSLLIQPGQKVAKEYYVLKGCLIAYYLDKAGQKHIIQFAIEDWWISDFEAFFNAYPAQLFVECIENSEVLSLDISVLEDLYFRIPKFERFFRLKITKAFVALRNRILSSLQKDSKTRYLEFCEQYPNLQGRVANYHIANYLGITPESLSRLRKGLH
ncbi:transcriptional regulator, Crp/Fnr family [Psychroflexus torquis ATCC 700755]|uniref:Transcriptional regulator, Crp/Fnr family n=1 Tax=Psychroflexus torquis (strain ATCC 700755 / CIP 106069 / ACAM 623) TaxID=313595 RepID=K4IB41_PSYTT|nr:Crp/Fnr family transcriptional regulator [Psychroflexus torquis]AFU67118.1 transcriptional regulator, Crp/Fnr family [Psychroflexus torquis ATCC 700755]